MSTQMLICLQVRFPVTFLSQPCRQRPKQGQFKPFPLPRFHGHYGPQEEHSERSENPEEKERDGGGDIGEQDSRQRRQKKHSPQQNALPGVKADEMALSKSG